MNKSTLLRHLSLFCICALFAPWASGQNDIFKTYAERKASEAELQGAFNLGIVSDGATVSVGDGNKIALPKGFIVKIVGPQYDNQKDSFIGYIAPHVKSTAFILPKTAVAIVTRSSPQWRETLGGYDQIVESLQKAADTSQSAAGAQGATVLNPPSTSTVSRDGHGQDIIEFIQDYQLVLGRDQGSPTAKMQFQRGQSFRGELFGDHAEVTINGLIYNVPRNVVVKR